MNERHEARFYEALQDGFVRCILCPHHCRIADGGRGVCGVRYHLGGKLYTLVYDKVVSQNIDPIEKKPMFHFYPGSRAWSIAAVGCSLHCAFCQNWEISQWAKMHLPGRIFPGREIEGREPSTQWLEKLEEAIPGEPVTPQTIVDAALAAGSTSIAYTYTEPTIFYELAFDTAVLARKRGLKNIFVTSGQIDAAPLRELAKVLDAANIDLKYFNEQSYQRISGVHMQPILDAIRLYRDLGVWVEVTTLAIPGINDSDEELKAIAEFVHSLGAEVPWHVSQFYPVYKMLDKPITPIETLKRARDIGHAEGLRYVYVGNVPGVKGEDTYCYQCGSLQIDRYGFQVWSNRIRNGRCPDCGALIDGVGMSGYLPGPSGKLS